VAGTVGAGTAGVFPFGFAGEAIAAGGGVPCGCFDVGRERVAGGESCEFGEAIAESDGVFPRDVGDREVFVWLAIWGVVEDAVVLAARDGMAGEGVWVDGDVPSAMATCVVEFDRACREGDEARGDGVEERRL